LVHKISGSETKNLAPENNARSSAISFLSAVKPDFRFGSLAVFYVEQFAGNRHALIIQ